MRSMLVQSRASNSEYIRVNVEHLPSKRNHGQVNIPTNLLAIPTKWIGSTSQDWHLLSCLGTFRKLYCLISCPCLGKCNLKWMVSDFGADGYACRQLVCWPEGAGPSSVHLWSCKRIASEVGLSPVTLFSFVLRWHEHPFTTAIPNQCFPNGQPIFIQ